MQRLCGSRSASSGERCPSSACLRSGSAAAQLLIGGANRRVRFTARGGGDDAGAYDGRSFATAAVARSSTRGPGAAAAAPLALATPESARGSGPDPHHGHDGLGIGEIPTILENGVEFAV
jgi:hypothetical protein